MADDDRRRAEFLGRFAPHREIIAEPELLEGIGIGGTMAGQRDGFATEPGLAEIVEPGLEMCRLPEGTMDEKKGWSHEDSPGGN
jgi:hypothetical protein